MRKNYNVFNELIRRKKNKKNKKNNNINPLETYIHVALTAKTTILWIIISSRDKMGTMRDEPTKKEVIKRFN